jgi:hypothetical protein
MLVSFVPEYRQYLEEDMRRSAEVIQAIGAQQR